MGREEKVHQGDDNRAVLVTGAAKGLGAVYASAWARRGACVVVNNRSHGESLPGAERLARSLRAEGHRVVADLNAVDAPGAAAAIVESAIRAFGRLDVLILNAGIAGPAAKIANLDEAALAEVMAINFTANVALVRAALPHLAAAPAPRILFISSTGGLHGVRGRAAYAASKGALNALALTLADEQRRAGIGVNILMPYAMTAMTATTTGAAPDPRFDPDRTTAAALWLTSPDCAETGQLWVAGAGRFRRARMMESIGLGADDATPEWVAANADAISDMTGARSYPGGEAAFADLCADAGINNS